MTEQDSEIQFSGEFFVPGKSGERIEADHLARYQFSSQFVSGQKVLDIACGIGYAAPLLLAAGAESYLGVDILPVLVENAKRTYGSERARFELGDITTFDPPERFGLITCFETIEHVPDYRAALRNLFRLIEPGGRLLISSPNRMITSPHAIRLEDKPGNPHHTQEFLTGELGEELRLAGFEVGPSDLFGQRQRVHFPDRYRRKLARMLLPNPDDHASPEVLPVKSKTPRYFLMRAIKPREA